MKTIKLLTVLVILTNINFTAFSQCDCSDALSTDLLDISEEYKETQFRDFLFEYFKASKKQRKSMKRNYSNSFGLKTVVQNLPLEFNSSNNSSKDSKEFYAFEQEVLKNQFVSNEIINSISTRYFSDNQLKAYKKCLELKCSDKSGVTTERGGDEFDVFYVRIIYNNVVKDSKLTVKSDVQYSGCSPVYGLTIRKGVNIKNGQDIVQYFKRHSPEKIATVNVNFENGISAPPVQLEKKSVNSSLPIGTIVASVLTFSEFQLQLTDKAFKKDESTWAPCDGREVRGSVFSNKYNKDFVPDLRDQFLRGNFTMGGPSEPNKNTPNGNNPRDGETVKNGYIYQNDEFKSHSHVIKTHRGMEARTGGSVVNVWINSQNTSTSPSGGTETRPKGIYVHYYIRIN